MLCSYSKWRIYHLFLLIGVYVLALYLLGWGWAVEQWAGSSIEALPGAELVIMLPFLAGLVLSWVCFYDAERALHNAVREEPDPFFWKRGSYVAFHVRQNLALIFIPIALLVVMKGLRRLWPESDQEMTATSCISLLPIPVIFLSLPLVLRLVLGLQPLPNGPMRERLVTAAHRLHLKFSNILVWNTHNGVANAMVVGIIPWLRYVVLTDRLLVEMDPDEVEAVFGHEIGHIKHHHMSCYLGFLFLSLGVLWLLGCLAMPGFQLFEKPEKALQAIPAIGVLGLYIFLVFGFLSRRCERQADLYGCRTVSCEKHDCQGHEDSVNLVPRARSLCPTGIRTFISALEKVASVNGISRDRPGWLQSWQHSTIARRVEFLQSVLDDPAQERHFQRRVSLVKWGLLLGLGALLSMLIAYGGAVVKQSQSTRTHGAESGVECHVR